MKMQKHTVPVMNVSMFVDRFYISTPAVYAACHYITSSTAETLWLINFVCRLRVLTDVQRFLLRGGIIPHKPHIQCQK